METSIFVTDLAQQFSLYCRPSPGGPNQRHRQVVNRYGIGPRITWPMAVREESNMGQFLSPTWLNNFPFHCRPSPGGPNQRHRQVVNRYGIGPRITWPMAVREESNNLAYGR
jgi:hypothetical protein